MHEVRLVTKQQLLKLGDKCLEVLYTSLIFFSVNWTFSNIKRTTKNTERERRERKEGGELERKAGESRKGVRANKEWKEDNKREETGRDVHVVEMPWAPQPPPYFM